MIKHIKLSNGIELTRLHSKLGEIITWSVEVRELPGRNRRIGIVRQLNEQWYKKKIGWREFPIKYWLGSNANGDVVTAETRTRIVNRMCNLVGIQ